MLHKERLSAAMVRSMVGVSSSRPMLQLVLDVDAVIIAAVPAQTKAAAFASQY